jgi:ketosteroid isomerase-like protein
MASANVELVRSIFAAWARGDYSSTEWADAEIEFLTPDGPTPGNTKGLAEMAQRTRDRLGAWEDIRMEAKEYRELDGERVLASFLLRGRGKTSGLDLDQIGAESASVFHIHDGKVTRLDLYWDRDRALADLGLAPETSSSDS